VVRLQGRRYGFESNSLFPSRKPWGGHFCAVIAGVWERKGIRCPAWATRCRYGSCSGFATKPIGTAINAKLLIDNKVVLCVWPFQERKSVEVVSLNLERRTPHTPAAREDGVRGDVIVGTASKRKGDFEVPPQDGMKT